MNRSLMLLSILGTLLAACGGNEGLTMRGGVQVTATGLSTGIGPFEQETRLDSIETMSTDRITGDCEMLRVLDADGVQQWSATATIQAPTTMGLSRITLEQTSGAAPEAAVVSATITQRDYASGAAGCAVDLPTAIGGNDGVVQFEGNCTLTDVDGNAVNADIDLVFEGCHVAPGTD